MTSRGHSTGGQRIGRCPGPRLKPQQLFGWRRRAMVDAGLISPQTSDGEADHSRCAAGTSMPFVELAIGESKDDGAIEMIVGGDVTIRVGPGVSMARLQMVLRAVRSA